MINNYEKLLNICNQDIQANTQYNQIYYLITFTSDLAVLFVFLHFIDTHEMPINK